METNWINILGIILSSGIIVTIIEFIRFKNKDKAEVATVDLNNTSIAHANNKAALESDSEILGVMKQRIEMLISDISTYQKLLEDQKLELFKLNDLVHNLTLENNRLKYILEVKDNGGGR